MLVLEIYTIKINDKIRASNSGLKFFLNGLKEKERHKSVSWTIIKRKLVNKYNMGPQEDV